MFRFRISVWVWEFGFLADCSLNSREDVGKDRGKRCSHDESSLLCGVVVVG